MLKMAVGIRVVKTFACHVEDPDSILQVGTMCKAWSGIPSCDIVGILAEKAQN